VTPSRDRLLLAAIATINGISGLWALALLAPLAAGADVETYRRGAIGIQAGVYATGFLYSPLVGVLATPLTWMPSQVAAMCMTGIGLAILAAGVRQETRGLDRVDRVLIAVAVIGFIPVVYELLLGQMTLLIAGAIYLVRDRDGPARGLPMGLALALVPKPVLIPVMVWMLVRRPRATAGAIITAAVVTIAGVLLLGGGIYAKWLAALVETGQIARRGNVSLTALEEPAIVLPVVVLTSLAMLWAIAAEERRGFVASLVGALLIQPFTLMYAASMLLVAVRPALAVAPRASRALAVTANAGVILAFPAWAVAALLAMLPIRARRPGRGAVGTPPDGPPVPGTGHTTPP
jgi:hypothetical protein